MDDAIFGGRYRVIERLGTGGMADVYKARDDVLGRVVALKVMHPQFAADPTFATRFRHEAQAAANLTNPHVVTVHDWGEENGTYYAVLEHVEGEDLSELIARSGPLPSSAVAALGKQVTDALSEAHGHGIVHRDISSKNILVTADGTAKVTDFGIARTGGASLTQTGSVLGNASYISPEQAQGLGVGPASDLYSLGVVLFEATTGRLPFEADSSVALALKHVNEVPPSARTINPDVDPRLDAVISRAWPRRPRSGTPRPRRCGASFRPRHAS